MLKTVDNTIQVTLCRAISWRGYATGHMFNAILTVGLHMYVIIIIIVISDSNCYCANEIKNAGALSTSKKQLKQYDSKLRKREIKKN